MNCHDNIKKVFTILYLGFLVYFLTFIKIFPVTKPQPPREPKIPDVSLETNNNTGRIKYFTAYCYLIKQNGQTNSGFLMRKTNSYRIYTNKKFVNPLLESLSNFTRITITHWKNKKIGSNLFRFSADRFQITFNNKKKITATAILPSIDTIRLSGLKTGRPQRYFTCFGAGRKDDRWVIAGRFVSNPRQNPHPDTIKEIIFPDNP
ncbi:MAG TPA: hypothetical protein VKS21_05065 [Spirochaetota bacterium]|nr:hypothetical protein [Spirochaetota bacterium]